MTNSKKALIYSVRLQGGTVRECAEAAQCTYQAISLVLKDLKGATTANLDTEVRKPQFDDETEQTLCMEIAQHNGNLESIFSSTGIDKAEINNAIAYICKRRPHLPKKYSIYKAVDDYLQTRLMSVSDLANQIHMPAGRLYRMLRRQIHIDLETALAIRDVTGISLTEIFGEEIPAQSSKIEKGVG